jgi:hypothetical protein
VNIRNVVAGAVIGLLAGLLLVRLSDSVDNPLLGDVAGDRVRRRRVRRHRGPPRAAATAA